MTAAGAQARASPRRIRQTIQGRSARNENATPPCDSHASAANSAAQAALRRGAELGAGSAKRTNAPQAKAPADSFGHVNTLFCTKKPPSERAATQPTARER